MPHYIITKTTIETLGIEVDSLVKANAAALKGQGGTISIQTTIVVRERLPAQPAQIGARPPAAATSPVGMTVGGTPVPNKRLG